jgi:hypothetical protein
MSHHPCVHGHRRFPQGIIPRGSTHDDRGGRLATLSPGCGAHHAGGRILYADEKAPIGTERHTAGITDGVMSRPADRQENAGICPSPLPAVCPARLPAAALPSVTRASAGPRRRFGDARPPSALGSSPHARRRGSDRLDTSIPVYWTARRLLAVPSNAGVKTSEFTLLVLRLQGHSREAHVGSGSLWQRQSAPNADSPARHRGRC